jgi:hypothetical protein
MSALSSTSSTILIAAATLLFLAGVCSLVGTWHWVAAVRQRTWDPRSGARTEAFSAEHHKQACERWTRRSVGAAVLSSIVGLTALVVSLVA